MQYVQNLWIVKYRSILHLSKAYADAANKFKLFQLFDMNEKENKITLSFLQKKINWYS